MSSQRLSKMEGLMIREQLVNFLESALIFLLMTNAASAAATFYAISLVRAAAAGGQDAAGLEERRVPAMIRRLVRN
jgi:hypothetical protein